MVHPTVVHPTVVHPTVVHAVVGKRCNFICVSLRKVCGKFKMTHLPCLPGSLWKQERNLNDRIQWNFYSKRRDDLICAQTIFFFYLLSNAFREISYMVLKGILCYL